MNDPVVDLFNQWLFNEAGAAQATWAEIALARHAFVAAHQLGVQVGVAAIKQQQAAVTTQAELKGAKPER